MAKRKGKRPEYSVVFSVRIGKGNYKTLASCGAWIPDNETTKGPVARGPLKGENAEELGRGLRKYEDSVNFAIFKNKVKDEYDDGDEDNDEDEEEEEEEEEAPSKKKSKKTSKSKKKSGGWEDFDDEEDAD